MIRLLASLALVVFLAAPALAQDDELPPLPTRAEVLTEIEALIDGNTAEEGVYWEIQHARRRLDYIWSGAGNMDAALQANVRAAIDLRLEDLDAGEIDREDWLAVAHLIARSGTGDQAADYLERARVWSERLAPPHDDYFYDAEERLQFLEQVRQRLNADVTFYANWAVPRNPDFDRERSAAALRDDLAEYVSPRIAPIERFAFRFAENDECDLALEVLRVGEIRDEMDRAQHNLLERELGGDPLNDFISVSHHMLPFERSSFGLRGATLILCGQSDALLDDLIEGDTDLGRQYLALIDPHVRLWDWMVESDARTMEYRTALAERLDAVSGIFPEIIANEADDFDRARELQANGYWPYVAENIATCAYTSRVLRDGGHSGFASDFLELCWREASGIEGEDRFEALAWLAVALPEDAH